MSWVVSKKQLDNWLRDPKGEEDKRDGARASRNLLSQAIVDGWGTRRPDGSKLQGESSG